MILKQYYLRCLARASCLVGDEQAAITGVMDMPDGLGGCKASCCP